MVGPGETRTIPYNIAFTPNATGASKAELEVHFHADGEDMPEGILVVGNMSQALKGKGVCQQLSTVASYNLTFFRALGALAPYLDPTALGLAYGLPVGQPLTLDHVAQQPGLLLDILHITESLAEVLDGALEQNDESVESAIGSEPVGPEVKEPLTVEPLPISASPNFEPAAPGFVRPLPGELMLR